MQYCEILLKFKITKLKSIIQLAKIFNKLKGKRICWYLWMTTIVILFIAGNVFVFKGIVHLKISHNFLAYMLF